jgi:hypothetical protein
MTSFEPTFPGNHAPECLKPRTDIPRLANQEHTIWVGAQNSGKALESSQPCCRVKNVDARTLFDAFRESFIR